MKRILFFLFLLLCGAGVVSAYFWGIKDISFDEQIAFIQSKINQKSADSVISNTSESASKLGKVLQGSFEEARDVYENGAEAKYE